MRKRGQFSIEYLMVVALVIAIIIPAVMLFYSYSQKSSTNILSSQINNIGLKITGDVKSVYALGRGSWITLEIYLPEKTESIELPSKNELVIKYDTEAGINEAVFFSDINMTNSSGGIGTIVEGRTGNLNLKIESTGGEVILEEKE